MAAVDRTLADYQSSGVTVGPHIMKYLRDELAKEGVVRAVDLPRMRDGRWTKIAGLVIVRQARSLTSSSWSDAQFLSLIWRDL